MNYEALHRELWNDLAAHPGMLKKDSSVWAAHGIDSTTVRQRCFACESSYSITRAHYCATCPITSEEEAFCCGGLFDDWERGDSEAAGKIAALPWKEKR